MSTQKFQSRDNNRGTARNIIQIEANPIVSFFLTKTSKIGSFKSEEIVLSKQEAKENDKNSKGKKGFKRA